MARDVNKRIQQLRTRRSGMDRLGRLSQDAQLDVLAKSLTEENWLKRAGSQPNTRYALGSMQEVTPEYTRISIETAERVGRQLDIALKNAGFSVDFRLQGSVPLNVHIRGVSDVDLLSLDTGFFVYATAGLRSQLGYYSGSASRRAKSRHRVEVGDGFQKGGLDTQPGASVAAFSEERVRSAGADGRGYCFGYWPALYSLSASAFIA
jgi:hypothetical protein